MKKKSILLVFIIFIGTTLMCCNTVRAENNNDIQTINEEELLNSINEFSTWIVYWDLDVSEKLSAYSSKLNSLSYFEAYFNEENKLEVPEELNSYIDKEKDYKFERYISITNDIVYKDGKTSNKDKEILKSILYDEELENQNIEEIINIAKKYSFDGIEMDYENLKNDTELWEKYIDLLKNLYEKCNQNNLKLRVLLEPAISEEHLNFFEGPTYIMMCYNLHSMQTEPGEKTNIDFINKLMKKIDYIPGSKEFAIPNGGFDWSENKKKSSAVTQSEAENLLGKYRASLKRDSTSGYLHFSYEDEEKTKHEVWYADEQTLKKLIDFIQDKGYKASIWRITQE